ncbi:hypothetical protein ALO80_200149 [Pseudomonas caricapapayae]|uniref:Uncharacterized protein n=1 Tax=Pseudomonas caricapapayae TaxID=46678 RepID=A0A0P9KKY1_9PSED|nr:hypothetical protein ALO80_200149 [Pseudomonas caricapapayae]RMM06910.1 hypothetical protein ALQ84_200288 [Pseudomonas caricapapayae]
MIKPLVQGQQGHPDHGTTIPHNALRRRLCDVHSYAETHFK